MKADENFLRGMIDKVSEGTEDTRIDEDAGVFSIHPRGAPTDTAPVARMWVTEDTVWMESVVLGTLKWDMTDPDNLSRFEGILSLHCRAAGKVGEEHGKS